MKKRALITLAMGLLSPIWAKSEWLALNPMSDFWKEVATRDYGDMFEDNTLLALVSARNSMFPIEYAMASEFVIHITERDGSTMIHLRDIYEDGEMTFSYAISNSDTELLIQFFQRALTTVVPHDPNGCDGSPYLLRVKGAQNEFGYTWSPDEFTFANDITIAFGMIRENCIRCIDAEFALDSITKEFLQIVQLTPDDMRVDFIDRLKLIPGHEQGPVDPFADTPPVEPEANAMTHYLEKQLALRFYYERQRLIEEN